MPKRSSKLSPGDLQKRLLELTEALQRERADAMNVRRRAEDERSKMATYYKAVVVERLLPAIDNLERALKHTPKAHEGDEYIKGIQSVAKQFEKTLEELGVEKIKTVGEEFDPQLHEAIGLEDGEGEVEIICEELQPGYVIGDEVIRHAMVKVKNVSKKGKKL